MSWLQTRLQSPQTSETSQAHPRPFRHVELRLMHESPHARPFRQTLQQSCAATQSLTVVWALGGATGPGVLGPRRHSHGGTASARLHRLRLASLAHALASASAPSLEYRL